MIIQLNVLQNGTCAQIYAYAEDHEKSFSTLHDARAIKIWHNEGESSMQTYNSTLNNCDNDYFILFKSSVPFAAFCEQFYTSEYNDSSKYNYYGHNCANAANHALKLANIDLEITNGIRLSRIYPNSIIKIPTTLITPSDLYHLAKNYKIKEFIDTKQPFSSIYFKIKLATKKLALRAKTADDDRIKDNIEIILSEIEQSMQTRTHHAEFYLKVLINTIDVAMYSTIYNYDDIEEYQNLSSYLKERELASSLQKQNQQLKIFALCLVLRSIEALAAIEEDWRVTYFLNMMLTFTTFNFLNRVSIEGYDYTPTKKNDTKLSKAISDLAACVEDRVLSTRKPQYEEQFQVCP